MSEKRSVFLYNVWLNSSTKFEEYITGVSIALVAYLGKNLTPLTCECSRSTFEFVGFVLILVSAILGLQRLLTTTVLLRKMHQQMHRSEVVGALLSSKPSESGMLQNTETGEVFSVEKARMRAERAQNEIERLQRLIDGLSRKALRYYKWRNVLLALGLVVIFVTKIWPETTP